MRTQSTILTDVAQFVRGHFPQFANVDVGESTELLARGLDSLAVLDLMTFLSERYGLELEEEDFAAENFETAGSLTQLVLRKAA
jgi:acyl carrier protein